MACADIAVAGTTRRFGFTEARLGLIPAVISPYRAARDRRPAAPRALFPDRRAIRRRGTRSPGAGARSAARRPELDARHRRAGSEYLPANGPDAIAAVEAPLDEVDATRSLARPTSRSGSRERGPSNEAREGMQAFLEQAAAAVVAGIARSS